MSDKNEYWNDIFGDDLSEELAKELGIDNTDNNSDEDFSIDESFFAKEDENKGSDSDTNVIPPEIKDVAAYTKSSMPIENPEHFKGNFDPGEDQGEDDGEEEDDDEYDRAIRVTRRKRTGCLGGLMYAAFILGASVIIACLGWMVAGDMFGLTKDDITAEITVSQDYKISDIADDLYEEGLIKYKTIFKFFCSIYNAEEKIQPGVYEIEAVDYPAIIKSMNQDSGELVEVDVTIPPGFTLEEIFQRLEENEVSTVELLNEAAANGEFDYDFLVGLGSDASRLEGYLFPDTYTFYKNQNAENVLAKMLSNFDTRLEDEGVYQMVEESDYSLHEILTIASLIEKEYKDPDELKTISSVIYNRLNADMPLGIDAAIQYILDERKEILTQEDLDIESPYNTYKNIGLPPGPIACPGMGAILAALEPESTNYYYYALYKDGETHRFFNSSEEQQSFIASEDYYYYGQ